MNKIVILGSSAEFPFPRTVPNNFENYLDIETYEKKFPLQDDLICHLAKKGGPNRRTRACAAVVVDAGVILLDASPDILSQLKKFHLTPDVILLTHEHPDANWGLQYLPEVNVISEKNKNLTHGKPMEILGVAVTPFRVQHSENAPATGFRLEIGRKTVVYLGDMANLGGIHQWVKDADIVFADGSILHCRLSGHMPITKQLLWYKKWNVKRVIFTHIGHETLPHDELVRYVKEIYKNADVAFDGMEIHLSMYT